MPTNRQPDPWPDWKLALATVLVLRVFYSVVAAVSSFILHPSPDLIRSNALTENLPPTGTWHYALVGVWERFDTLWYLHIAQYGYDRPMAVIFYPLYPATIRMASWILPPTIAALLISTVASIFFFCGLLRLAGTDLSAKSRVLLLALICAWPASFMLFAGYAEALTGALIVWAVVFARDNRWWPAAACGFLAGVARPSGVLVAIPLLMLAWKNRRPASLLALLTPLGTLAYWGWLRWSGRPSVVDAYRIYQGMPWAPPWQGLWLILRLAVHGDALLAMKFALAVLAAIFAFRRPARFEDKLFAAAVFSQMFMYSNRPAIGATRYILVIYPAFLGMAAFAGRRLKAWQFSFYVAALGFLNLMFMVAFLKWSLVL